MRSAFLELLIPSVCPGCDAPRREGATRLCSRCAAALHPLRALGAVPTAIAYEGLGARLVRRFKFEGRRDALDVLLEALVERAEEIFRERPVQAVVPVPRHPRRVRELGTDPVYLLARGLARRLGLGLRGRVLARTRPTPPQTELPPGARRANVAGSFACRNGVLRGCRVALLDDVTTTGATLEAASRELRSGGGASAVVTLALAGTPTV